MNSNVMMQKLVLIAPLVARAVLYVLIGLSVLSIGVIIERWWYFRRRRDDIDALSDPIRRAFARGDLAAVRKALSASKSVEAEIIAEAIDWHGEGPDAVEQILGKALRMRRKKFESGLLFLGTLGNNAPFIGLFGTVLGIVTAFRELGRQPDGRRHGQRHGRHRRGAAGDRGRHPGRDPGRRLLQPVPEEGGRHRGGRRRDGQRRDRVDAGAPEGERHRAPPPTSKPEKDGSLEHAGRPVGVEA